MPCSYQGLFPRRLFHSKVYVQHPNSPGQWPKHGPAFDEILQGLGSTKNLAMSLVTNFLCGEPVRCCRSRFPFAATNPSCFANNAKKSPVEVFDSEEVSFGSHWIFLTPMFFFGLVDMQPPLSFSMPKYLQHASGFLLLGETGLTSLDYMGVSKNRGFTPKSSILLGFSIIFTLHFWGNYPYFFGGKHPQKDPQKSSRLNQAAEAEMACKRS